MEKTLDTWIITQENIKRNEKPRINWRAILNGNSLNRACYRFSCAGLDAELTYKTLVFEHPELSEEAKRRLWIGVNARFSELGTAKSELRKVKK